MLIIPENTYTHLVLFQKKHFFSMFKKYNDLIKENISYHRKTKLWLD